MKTVVLTPKDERGLKMVIAFEDDVSPEYAMKEALRVNKAEETHTASMANLFGTSEDFWKD